MEISDLKALAAKCYAAKIAADNAREYQLECEKEFLEAASKYMPLKEKGTTKYLDGFVNIKTKYNQKWDQKMLKVIIANEGLPIIPFNIEYKPDNKALEVLRDTFPDAYMKLCDALTESPAKPYFEFREIANERA